MVAVSEKITSEQTILRPIFILILAVPVRQLPLLGRMMWAFREQSFQLNNVARAALASIEQSNFNHSEGMSMTKVASWLMGTVAIVLAVFGGKAISAQDRYTVQVPNGLAFSEFRGYEDWQAVAISQTDEALAVILANPVMIEAYRAGIPGNGQHFPDGSKIAKIHWKPKKSADAPAPTTVPDTLHDVDFIERDSRKFPDTGGWGYAQFNYDAASDTFTPEGSGTDCGYACHTIVTAKDYIFTAYPKR